MAAPGRARAIARSAPRLHRRTVSQTPAPSPRGDAPNRLADLEAAFDALVRREYARLAELAYALLGNRADAEEVVQDVPLGVWRHRARFDFAAPRAYLARAVRNRVISRRRQQSTERRWAAVQPHDLAVSPDQHSTERDELLRALDRAVDTLPARSREIFILQRVNGLTYAEIAATLGIAPKTVENLLGRVLQKLRKVLRGHLGLSVVVTLAARFLVR